VIEVVSLGFTYRIKSERPQVEGSLFALLLPSQKLFHGLMEIISRDITKYFFVFFFVFESHFQQLL
jgi:hypothetical protein